MKQQTKLLLNISARPRGVEEAFLSWSSPLMELDAQDRTTLMESPEFIFADSTRSLVYCDLFPVSARGEERRGEGRGGEGGGGAYLCFDFDFVLMEPMFCAAVLDGKGFPSFSSAGCPFGMFHVVEWVMLLAWLFLRSQVVLCHRVRRLV